MKKCLAAFSLLLIGCIGFTAYLQTSLLAEKDNVIFEDTILYGDADTVEGLTVNIDSQSSGHHFWETTYIAGKSPEVSSDYTFFVAEQHDSYKPENNIYMNLEVENYYFEAQDSNYKYEGINQAVHELYQEMDSNETKTKTVYLKDYYDYYSMYLSITMDDFDYYWNWNTMFVDCDPSEVKEYADYLFLKEFFRIPVLEDDTRTIVVSTSDGHVESTMIGYDAMKEPYYFQSYGAITKDAFVFTFSLDADSLGTTYDTSLIPGGYGLYHMPYTTEEKETRTAVTVNVQELSMAYPLDTDIEILGLSTTYDQSQIILVYADGADSNTKATFIDSSSMQEIQTIILDGIPKEDGSTEILIPYNMHIYDDFIAMDCSGQYLVVLNLTDGGLYELAFVVDIYENPIFTYGIWGSYETSMDWNGEQIVVAGNIVKNIDVYSDTEYCSFYLAVFDKNGLVYFSEHDSSLDQASYPFGTLSRYNYYGTEPILKVVWK